MIRQLDHCFSNTSRRPGGSLQCQAHMIGCVLAPFAFMLQAQYKTLHEEINKIEISRLEASRVKINKMEFSRFEFNRKKMNAYLQVSRWFGSDDPPSTSQSPPRPEWSSLSFDHAGFFLSPWDPSGRGSSFEAVGFHRLGCLFSSSSSQSRRGRTSSARQFLQTLLVGPGLSGWSLGPPSTH